MRIFKLGLYGATKSSSDARRNMESSDGDSDLGKQPIYVIKIM